MQNAYIREQLRVIQNLSLTATKASGQPILNLLTL